MGGGGGLPRAAASPKRQLAPILGGVVVAIALCAQQSSCSVNPPPSVRPCPRGQIINRHLAKAGLGSGLIDVIIKRLALGADRKR